MEPNLSHTTPVRRITQGILGPRRRHATRTDIGGTCAAGDGDGRARAPSVVVEESESAGPEPRTTPHASRFHSLPLGLAGSNKSMIHSSIDDAFPSVWNRSASHLHSYSCLILIAVIGDGMESWVHYSIQRWQQRTPLHAAAIGRQMQSQARDVAPLSPRATRRGGFLPTESCRRRHTQRNATERNGTTPVQSSPGCRRSRRARATTTSLLFCFIGTAPVRASSNSDQITGARKDHVHVCLARTPHKFRDRSRRLLY